MKSPWLLVAAIALPACGDDAPMTVPADAAPDVADASLDAPSPVKRGVARATVSRYEYTLDLDSRRASARLTLAIEGAGDCLVLPYRPAAPEEVTLDGEPARGVLVENAALTACDPRERGWSVGRTVVLTASFELGSSTLRPTQVGYSTRNDLAGRPFTYLLSWVGECDRHGPCDTNPGRFATYRFTVTHPSGTRVFCPGTITAEDTRTVCAFELPGGPTYSTFAVMAGRSWVERDYGTEGGVRVTLYDIPGSRVGSSLQAPRVREFLRWMTETFGAYPYGDALRLVVAPTYWAGFEHPGTISLAESLTAAEHTTLHEIAHQWAGDQTTLATVRDFVWKEAMAEYLSFVWEDEHRGHDVALTTARSWKASSQRAMFHPVPTTDVPLVQFYNAAYGPGPLVLFRQLEVRYGRPAVLTALRAVLGRPSTLSVDALRSALEASTGASLQGYFDAWLRGEGAPTWPTVSARREPDGAIALTLTPGNGRAQACRFRVLLASAGAAQLEVPMELALGATTPVTVTARPTFAVTRIDVDPEAEALVFPDLTVTGFDSMGMLMVPPPRPATPWIAP